MGAVQLYGIYSSFFQTLRAGYEEASHLFNLVCRHLMGWLVHALALRLAGRLHALYPIHFRNALASRMIDLHRDARAILMYFICKLLKSWNVFVIIN